MDVANDFTYSSIQCPSLPHQDETPSTNHRTGSIPRTCSTSREYSNLLLRTRCSRGSILTDCWGWASTGMNLSVLGYFVFCDGSILLSRLVRWKCSSGTTWFVLFRVDTATIFVYFLCVLPRRFRDAGTHPIHASYLEKYILFILPSKNEQAPKKINEKYRNWGGNGCICPFEGIPDALYNFFHAQKKIGKKKK